MSASAAAVEIVVTGSAITIVSKSILFGVVGVKKDVFFNVQNINVIKITELLLLF